jgi:hypothetical protein
MSRDVRIMHGTIYWWIETAEPAALMRETVCRDAGSMLFLDEKFGDLSQLVAELVGALPC